MIKIAKNFYEYHELMAELTRKNFIKLLANVTMPTSGVLTMCRTVDPYMHQLKQPVLEVDSSTQRAMQMDMNKDYRSMKHAKKPDRRWRKTKMIDTIQRACILER